MDYVPVIDLKLETAYLQGTNPIYNNGYDNDNNYVCDYDYYDF